MDSITICRNILKLLNNYAEAHGLNHFGLGPTDYLKELNISEQQLNVNIDFLEQEGYIKVLKALGTHFVSTHLTSTGRKLLMNPSEFNRTFPSSSLTIIHGNNNVSGSNIVISDSFNQVEQVIEKSELTEELKSELKILIIELVNKSNSKDLKDNKLNDFFSNVLVKLGEQSIPQVAIVAIKGILAHFGITI
ncbi:hypothetical protein ACR77J_09455 [Tissierella praeacuta]|uniref:hypothetical protein n=1 Tax=Tissierella praeacuta TaxID=43131 RepID=UPI003DA5C5D9